MVTNAVSLLLLAVLAASATLDFMRSETAFAVTDRLGIPRDAVPTLGGVKCAAALGVFIGTDIIRLAELSGAFLVLYFTTAVLVHVRVKDTLRNTAPAAAMLFLSVSYLLGTVAR